MKILVVDYDDSARNGLVHMLMRLYNDASVISSSDSFSALMEFSEEVDVVFLKTDMPEIDGIVLAKRMMKKKAKLNVIFVADDETKASDAFAIHASGYLKRPFVDTQMKFEMENLRYPLSLKAAKFQIQCFGNFEIFHNGKPVYFQRSGAKAIFAYLIDRNGATVSVEEMCTSFWEDADNMEKKKSNIRTMLKSLRYTLVQHNMSDVLISRRNSYAINPELIECDYYRYLEDPIGNKGLFHGEYMSQYSWAERTLGNLTTMDVL